MPNGPCEKRGLAFDTPGPVNILIAPQCFKGTLPALDVAQAIAQGIHRIQAGAQTVLLPLADGGEGTVQALVNGAGGRFVTTEVTGPLGKTVVARWGMLQDGQTGAIEMSAASGITLIAKEDLNPLAATSYGTGHLIRAALDAGCRRLIIGLGDSATNDGGAGMAQALGVKFLDAGSRPLPLGGGALIGLERIDVSDLDPRLSECDVVAAYDVDNPLCGSRGASLVYGPQKGANPQMAAELDRALAHYALVLEEQLGVEVVDNPGCGAAGGLGAGLKAFSKARLRPGFEVVAEACGLIDRLRWADVVFTGEGRIDNQTACGKTVAGVAKRAKEFGLPVVVIVGQIGEGYRTVYDQGVDAVVSIAPGPISFQECKVKAKSLTAEAAERAMRLALLFSREDKS